jgi:hypothetical protein
LIGRLSRNGPKRKLDLKEMRWKGPERKITLNEIQGNGPNRKLATKEMPWNGPVQKRSKAKRWSVVRLNTYSDKMFVLLELYYFTNYLLYKRTFVWTRYYIWLQSFQQLFWFSSTMQEKVFFISLITLHYLSIKKISILGYFDLKILKWFY